MKIYLSSHKHALKVGRSLRIELPNLKLASAQDFVAQMLGYRGLHELTEVSKSGKHEPSEPDETCNEYAVAARRKFQAQKLAELTGIEIAQASKIVERIRPSASSNKPKTSEICSKNNQGVEQVATLFSSPSFRPPERREYFKVAEEFIAKSAPSLDEELQERLAVEVVNAMFGEIHEAWRWKGFADPLLQQNRNWIWPQLAKQYPHTNEGQIISYGTYPSCDFWHPMQSRAKHKAEEMERLDRVPLGAWASNQPMQVVRAWRNELLPDIPKRGTKYDILHTLLNDGAANKFIVGKFQRWRLQMRRNRIRFERVAATKPKPNHLWWLAELTVIKLNGYHDLHNRDDGPEAFKRLISVCQSCAGKPFAIKDALIQELVAAVFNCKGIISLYKFDDESMVKTITESVERTVHAFNSPDSIKSFLSRYTPISLVYKACRACQSDGYKGRIAKRDSAPFDIACHCKEPEWVSREWIKLGEHSLARMLFEYRQTIDMWIIKRLMGIEKPKDDSTFDSERAKVAIRLIHMEDNKRYAHLYDE